MAISIGVHLVLALLSLLRPEPPISTAVNAVDIELIKGNEGRAPSQADHQRTPADRGTTDRVARRHALNAPARHAIAAIAPRQNPRSANHATNPRRAAPRRSLHRPSPALPTHKPNARGSGTPMPPSRRRTPDAGCLLSMRGCKRRDVGNTASRRTAQPPSKQRRDRHASFFPNDGTRRIASKQPQSRVSSSGIEMSRYEDGGRLVRALGERSRPPGFGEQHLLALATRRIGGSIGRTACDVYRGVPRRPARLLVVMVDTSGSVISKKKAPAALVCAAGAVLSALDRGYRVALVNFSSETRYLKPTRDRDVIYGVMSSLQGQGTRLPKMALLELPAPRRVAHDYVLITDGVIENLKEVLPGYGIALARNRKNRGVLYVLGEGGGGVSAISEIGFRPDRVEKGDTTAFVRYASETLKRLLPL